MAQNEESRLTEWSSWECKSRKSFGVIGSFWVTVRPLALFMPVRRDFNGQLLSKGFGRPISL